MEQGSKEWFDARCGKVTASRVADLSARTRNGYSSLRATYMSELLVERITGLPVEKYKTPAMEWGTAHEKTAREVYEGLHGNLVQTIGFVPHPSIENSGCSPDGLVDDDGLIEIKCPNTSTHLETVMSGEIPDKYIPQMMWQMACTGRQWCDFISFDPRVPPKLALFTQRIERDDSRIADLEAEVVKFINELNDKIHKLNELGEQYNGI